MNFGNPKSYICIGHNKICVTTRMSQIKTRHQFGSPVFGTPKMVLAYLIGGLYPHTSTCKNTLYIAPKTTFLDCHPARVLVFSPSENVVS